MPNQIKWQTTIGTFNTLIAGATTAPTLKALASGGRKIGSAITGNRDQFCALRLRYRGASAPGAGAFVEVYLVPSVDGSVYSDGSDTVTPQNTVLAAVIPVAAVSTQQIIDVPKVELPPFDFKALVVNSTGVAFTNTDNENVLSFRPYNHEIQ